MPLIPFPEYKPDLSPYGTGASVNILNVIPRGDGYGPVQDLVSVTAALPAACRGFFYARKSDGSIQVFAATSVRLYLLNNTTYAWGDVSAGGPSDYSGLSSTDQWQFAQFGNDVIAVQANVAPQVYTMGSSTQFAALGGSPPQARYVSIINRFVVLSGLLPREVPGILFAYRQQGFALARKREIEGWATLLLRRSSAAAARPRQ